MKVVLNNFLGKFLLLDITYWHIWRAPGHTLLKEETTLIIIPSSNTKEKKLKQNIMLWNTSEVVLSLCMTCRWTERMLDLANSKEMTHCRINNKIKSICRQPTRSPFSVSVNVLATCLSSVVPPIALVNKLIPWQWSGWARHWPYSFI